MYESQLLSETLVIVGAALTILLALRFRDSPSGRRAVAVGAACGFMTLVRAEQILLLGFLLVPLVLIVRGGSPRRRLGWLAAAMATGVLVLAPWIGFNLSRYQQPTYLTTNFGAALAIANCNATYHGQYIGYLVYQCSDAAAASVGAGGLFVSSQLEARHEDDSTLDAAYRKFGLRYIRTHLSGLPAAG
jgi:4-amino-4-deoxy-L-arabinose transferase-like glycosyltransferase